MRASRMMVADLLVGLGKRQDFVLFQIVELLFKKVAGDTNIP
jgi:hypothetical protein